MIPLATPSRLSWLRTPTGLLTLTVVVLAAIYAATEHGDHLVALLPFAFILLCPLMHLFMHGGHGGHTESSEHRRLEP